MPNGFDMIWRVDFSSGRSLLVSAETIPQAIEKAHPEALKAWEKQKDWPGGIPNPPWVTTVAYHATIDVY